MTINQRVTQHLEKLAQQGPKAVEAVILTSPRQKGYIMGLPSEKKAPAVTLTLKDYDRYSATLRKLEVNLPVGIGNNGATEAYLRHCVQQVAQRLTYLESPLVLLELDASQTQAQLRSDPPTQTDEEIHYWESLINLTPLPKISLAHYRWIANQHEREIIAYPATFITLGRLAQDLALSLSEVV